MYENGGYEMKDMKGRKNEQRWNEDELDEGVGISKRQKMKL